MKKGFVIRNDQDPLTVRWRWDRHGEIVILHVRREYSFLLLNQSAALIWALCDGSRTEEDIADALEASYGVCGRSRWARFVGRTVSKLKRRGLLCVNKTCRPKSVDVRETLSFFGSSRRFCRPRITLSDGEGFLLSHGTRPGSPVQAYLVLTHRCNFRCRHCYEKRHEDPRRLTTEEVKGIIDRLVETGVFVLTLTGGEPFLREDILETVAYACGKGLYVRINTNGSLITREHVRVLSAYRGRLLFSVSLEGATGPTHDLNRGAGAFNAALAAVTALKGAGLDVLVDYTVNRRNCRELTAAYRLCEKMGVNAMNVGGFNPLGFGGKREEELALSALGYRFFFYRFLFFAALRRLTGRGGRTRLVTYSNRRCLAGTLYFAVDVTGNISHCELMEYSAGNIFTLSPADVWDSPEMIRVLDARNFRVPCSVCVFRHTCNGKCRAYVYETTGDIMQGNPCCIRGSVFRAIHHVPVLRRILAAVNRAVDARYSRIVGLYAPYKREEIARAGL